MAQEELQFSFADLMGIVRRNLFLVFLLASLGAVGAYVASLYVPKQYKATAEISIQAGYFHNPLVNDIIASVYDPSELNAQKATLFRLALNDEFLDSIGEKYGLFKYEANSDGRALEREELLKNIEYYSLNATTYYLAVRSTNPKQAYQILQDMVDKVKTTLMEERRQTLVNTRDAIKESVHTLGLALRDVADPFSAQRSELEKLEVQIQTLTSKFTERHPDVVALRRQANVLERALRDQQPAVGERQEPDVYASSAKASTQDIHLELLKKLSYLNIVLQMESDKSNISYLGMVKEPSIPIKPYFPKKRIFAGAGLVVGLLLGLVASLFRELHRGTFLSPVHASDALGVEFLGTLPALVGRRRGQIRLLDGPQRMLPYNSTVEDNG